MRNAKRWVPKRAAADRLACEETVRVTRGLFADAKLKKQQQADAAKGKAAAGRRKKGAKKKGKPGHGKRQQKGQQAPKQAEAARKQATGAARPSP